MDLELDVTGEGNSCDDESGIRILEEDTWWSRGGSALTKI